MQIYRQINLNLKHQLKIYAFLISGLIVLLLAVIIFFGYAPRYIEQSRNLVANSNTDHLLPASLHDLHQSLLIADFHADSLLWNRDLSKKSSYGHVDIPRLIEGNVALQVFSVVTKVPHGLNIYHNKSDSDKITYLALAQRWPLKTWISLFERAIFQAEKLQQVENKLSEQFQIIKSKQELQSYLKHRENHPQTTAGLLSLEGGHALEGDINNLDLLHAAGFRIIGFSHFFDNKLGGSAHGINKGGLSEFGQKVLKRAEELKILIDLSHASPLLIHDIIAYSNRPVLASHTGIHAICPSAHRNLTDEQLIAVAGTGGLIGIGFWSTASCSDDVTGIVKSIRYSIDLVGEDHVALGSDFDGNVQVPFAVDNMAQLTTALVEAGLTESQIRKVMGENLIRVLLTNLPTK